MGWWLVLGETRKKNRRAIKPDGDRVTPILIMENGGKVCVSALPPYFHFTILYNSFKIGKFTYKLIPPVRHNILVLLPRARIEREGGVEQFVNLVVAFLCVEFFNLLSRIVDYRLRNVAAGVAFFAYS